MIPCYCHQFIKQQIQNLNAAIVLFNLHIEVYAVIIEAER